MKLSRITSIIDLLLLGASVYCAVSSWKVHSWILVVSYFCIAVYYIKATYDDWPLDRKTKDDGDDSQDKGRQLRKRWKSKL